MNKIWKYDINEYGKNNNGLHFRCWMLRIRPNTRSLEALRSAFRLLGEFDAVWCSFATSHPVAFVPPNNDHSHSLLAFSSLPICLSGTELDYFTPISRETWETIQSRNRHQVARLNQYILPPGSEISFTDFTSRSEGIK